MGDCDLPDSRRSGHQEAVVIAAVPLLLLEFQAPVQWRWWSAEEQIKIKAKHKSQSIKVRGHKACKKVKLMCICVPSN